MFGANEPARTEWSDGHRGTIAIPQARPTPFDLFLVFATDLLWEWWRSPAPGTESHLASVAPKIASGDGDWIERLFAGPDAAELSAREMAMLEAYLMQPVSFSQMQQEARAAGRSETAQVRNKLKLIRDFNHNLRAINPLATHPEPEESRSLETSTVLRGVGPTEGVGDKGELTQTGFLGGTALAETLGIHPSRRDAFFRRLERQRISLGDDCWHEVREPRPNSPRFLYNADSAQLRELVKASARPKPAQGLSGQFDE